MSEHPAVAKLMNELADLRSQEEQAAQALEEVRQKVQRCQDLIRATASYYDVPVPAEIPIKVERREALATIRSEGVATLKERIKELLKDGKKLQLRKMRALLGDADPNLVRTALYELREQNVVEANGWEWSLLVRK